LHNTHSPQQDCGAVVGVIASPPADHSGMSAALVEPSIARRLVGTRADLGLELATASLRLLALIGVSTALQHIALRLGVSGIGQGQSLSTQ
jgi:hypothetical protein